MDQSTKDILESVNFIKDRMLTKDNACDITREVVREEVPAMIREERCHQRDRRAARPGARDREAPQSQ